MDTAEKIEFIRKNYYQFNNRELAEVLSMNLAALRTLCYELGLKRIQLEYFTSTQISFLRNNFQKKGDVELAEIFQKKWPKVKGWTKKHIEKKRKYLKLQRTKEQIKKIHQRNVKTGRFKICIVKAWNKRGRAPEGEIRYWHYSKSKKQYPVIKINGKFIPWARWFWQSKFGNIPPDMKVIFKGNNTVLAIENLALVSNKEMAQMNSIVSSKGLSDNYVAGVLAHNNPALRKIIKQHPNLIEIKRKQLTLNRIIYEHQIS